MIRPVGLLLLIAYLFFALFKTMAAEAETFDKSIRQNETVAPRFLFVARAGGGVGNIDKGRFGPEISRAHEAATQVNSEKSKSIDLGKFNFLFQTSRSVYNRGMRAKALSL